MTKFKKIVARLITYIMIFSIIGSSNFYKVYAKENSVKVKVRIEANDHTIVSEKEIEVDNFDLKDYGATENKDSIMGIHAVIKALENENINCKDINKFNSRGCTYLDNIDGVKERSVSGNDGWMYFINNKYAADYIGNVQIHDNDSIVVFFQEDYTKNKYAWFDKNTITTKMGENITLNLAGSKEDVSSDKGSKSTILPISDAKILVDNKEYIVNGKYVTTDKEGNVTLNFDKEGTYEISAVRFDKDTKRRDISRPYCKVVVEKGEVKIDKTSLINSIAEVEKMLSKVQVGTMPGQYTQDTKRKIQMEIDEAKGVLNKNIDQKEIDLAVLKLQNAILTFKKSINKDETLQQAIADVVSYYNTWKDNDFKKFDFITTMALRRAGVNTDDIFSKINIYNTDTMHNNSRNVMNIIGVGKNPKDYRGKDYTKLLIDCKYEDETSAECIAKAIIAMDMAEVDYDKEKIVGELLNKVHEEDGKSSFGKIEEGSYDDMTGETEDDEYTPYTTDTAWSLIALSNHKNIKNTTEVIEQIKKFLKSKQDKHGLIEDSTNTALLIQGLISLGEDPNDDYWCVKGVNKKVTMTEGILKCKKDNQFTNDPVSDIKSDIATPHVLAALVDLNTMSSMYKKLRFKEISSPVKLEISGEKEVYSGVKLKLVGKAFDYNNVVIKNAAISWKSSDEKIATVKDGVVQALKEGEVEISAYITGNEIIKDNIKIKVTTPPKVDYSEKLNEEIKFLQESYNANGGYEFLAAPAAILSGMDREKVKNNIYRYTENSTALINAKNIVELLAVGLDPKHDSVKGEEINYVDTLEKSQLKDGENKGRFVVNPQMDQTSIETQAYCIIVLDLVKGKYDKELAVKALLNMLNDPNYKEKDSLYEYIKTEAVAVTALGKHKDVSGTEIKIKELISFFKENQNNDGAFDVKAGSPFVNSPRATGAVVQALLSNGIDPLSWQWTKNGKTILDGMLKSKFIGREPATSGYAKGEGSGLKNQEATYYAFSTLVELLNKKSIFDMMEENVKPSVVKVESISLDKTSIELKVGETLKLNAIVVPGNVTNKKVIWTSDNEKVATVDSEGNVQAVTSGEAIVKVMTEDGQKSVECKVVIKAKEEVKVQQLEVQNLTSIKEFKLGTDAKVSIQAKNNTKEIKKITFIVGLFDDNGKFVNYIAAKQDIEIGKNVELNGMIKLPKEGKYTVKAFVWDSLEGMTPLSNVIEIPVK